MIDIDYDANASTVSPPVFHLKRASIRLYEETCIASLNRALETKSVRRTQNVTLHEKGFEGKRSRIEGHLDLRNVMDTAIPHHVTPTFKTFNVAPTYSLEVYVRLESSG